MTPDTWHRVKEVFQASIELEPRRREAFLNEACGNDEALSREVRILLDHYEQAGDFLENPPGGERDPTAEDEDAWFGRRVGAWQVGRKLGRGGTSTVYLATRADESYQQKVALKLLRRGLDTDDVLRRFRQERQILAGLDHLHVARLLDGGTTDDGRPYLVMEYVRGLPIDAYCNRHRLETRQRLQLFRTVCAAVGYAHRNLVVHRDLKPSNILVSDEGVPKLLDFGIAKLLGAELAAVSHVSTMAAHRVMTPRYASPEQVRGLPVTTASDTYSLGVLLYELLTGRRPYELSELLTADVERVVCDELPPRPSTVATPRKLRRQLAGDLDNVVLRALAKEPERRYASGDELEGDLERFLAGRPVRARPAAWGYRARKFVARHKAGVTLAALVWAALVLGLGLALWQADVARAERDRAENLLEEAEQQRARANQVTSFLLDVFRVVEPGEARGQTPTAEEILARGAEKVRQELEEQPETKAAIMDAIGRVYYGLGLYDDAVRHFEEALGIRRRLFPEAHPDVAESLYHRGWVPHARGDLEAAETYYQQALENRRALLGPDDPAVAEILNELGELVLDQGDPETARRFLHEALRIRRQTLGPEHPELATSLDDLAILESTGGNHDEAVALHREALAMRRKAFGEIHPAVASTLNGLGQTLRRKGRYVEAEQVAREALAIWRRIHGEEHRTVAGTMVDLGQVLAVQGEHDEAQRLLSESLAMSRRLLSNDHPQVAVTLNSLAMLFFTKEDYRQAGAYYRQVLEIRRRTRGPDHPSVLQTLDRLAFSLLRLGEPARAEPLFRDALSRQREVLGAGHPDVAESLHGLGLVLLGRGKAAVAEPLLREAVKIRREAFGEHWLTAGTEVDLTECLIAVGRRDEARELLLGAYHFLLDDRGPEHPRTEAARRRLNELDPDRARP